MPESKKTIHSQKKPKATAATSKKSTKIIPEQIPQNKASSLISSMGMRVQGLLMRRPHKTFQRTRRRDYVRSLKLPGYWGFTNYVRKTLWSRKKLFAVLMLTYGLLTAALVGISSQDNYTQLGDTLRSTGQQLFEGAWGGIGEAGIQLATNITGAYSNALSDVQQMYAVILGLLTWLTTVWLLRGILAGHKPKFRDGVYNAGAPILPTFLVALVVVVQLLPVAFAALAFSAGLSSGILSGGVESMLFWVVALLLTILSLYWITSTVIALVVVTLPGMYPMQALKVAGDLVIGRRIRILYRIVWLLLFLAVLWAVVIIPVILFDTWLKGMLPAIQWLPLVPIALLIMSTFSVVWAASYIYLLYRKVVNDDTAPA